MSQVKGTMKVAKRNYNCDSIDNTANENSSSEGDFFKSIDGSLSSNTKNDLEIFGYL